MPWGMWDLCSLTRFWTHAPAVEAQSLQPLEYQGIPHDKFGIPIFCQLNELQISFPSLWLVFPLSLRCLFFQTALTSSRTHCYFWQNRKVWEGREHMMDKGAKLWRNNPRVSGWDCQGVWSFRLGSPFSPTGRYNYWKNNKAFSSKGTKGLSGICTHLQCVPTDNGSLVHLWPAQWQAEPGESAAGWQEWRRGSPQCTRCSFHCNSNSKSNANSHLLSKRKKSANCNWHGLGGRKPGPNKHYTKNLIQCFSNMSTDVFWGGLWVLGDKFLI